MFAAPPEVTAEVAGSIPAELEVTDRISPWLSGRGISGTSFLEGPSFDRDGDLYCVDLAYGRILRLDRAGRFSVATEYDGQPNGLKVHPDGRLFVADRVRGVVVVDPRAGDVRPLVESFRGAPLRGPNDLVFGPDGALYVTDQGDSDVLRPSGRILRVRENQVEVLLDRLPSPNGIAFSPDARRLFVAMTRANAVWSVELHPDGTIVRVGSFIGLSGGTGPDGLAVDAEGGLAVAHTGLGSVWLFDAAGEPRLRVRSPVGPLTTNLAFDPLDPTMIYITESRSGSVLRARMPVPGLPLYSHRDRA